MSEEGNKINKYDKLLYFAIANKEYLEIFKLCLESAAT